jgi:predicted RNA methylase
MSKLTKQQAALHAQACALLEKDVLTFDDRLFVLSHWQESANHINGVAGAFFTPPSLARDFSIEVCGHSIIDLCAGIGSLSFAAFHFGARFGSTPPKITCVEINPAYVDVGRKVLPEATWILADALDLPASLTAFDCAIANPPFGSIKQAGKSLRYTGRNFEYKLIDVASDRAKYGVFLIPQSSAPFRFSGVRSFEETSVEKYQRFTEQTAIELEPSCGIDTSITQNEWHGVSVSTEIVVTDFEEARVRRGRIEPSDYFQTELFAVV